VFFIAASSLRRRHSHFSCRRRVVLPHLGQYLFGRNAAIHDPDAPRRAVLRRDLGEKRSQRLVVLGVAGKDFVGQWQAFRRDHQSDHHLRAIRSAVTAVAVPAFVAFRQGRGVDLKVSTGQIAEQHSEAGVEQVPPAPDQMRKQGVLVRQQPIVTGVQLVRFGQAEIGAQQIGHGAVAEPLAMQLPLAARGDQPIGCQNLKNLVPARPLPARRQTLGPEPVQLQFAPQLTRKPARAPLPRPPQCQRRQTNMNRRGVVDRLTAILREQRLGSRPVGRLIGYLDRLAPCRGLRRINLSQILAVFPASGLSQKHDNAKLGASMRPAEWGRSSLQRFLPVQGIGSPIKPIACTHPTPRKSPMPPANPGSRAKEI
jgi:hypothetical protein